MKNKSSYYAELLDGSQYRRLDYDVLKNMGEDNCVVVYGASDDLMETDGAVSDEFGCFNGGTAYIDKRGEFVKKSKNKVVAIWNDSPDGPCWKYETNFPVERFMIYEDDDLYCEAIVFSLEDLS